MSFGLELGTLLEETSICIHSLTSEIWSGIRYKMENASWDSIRSLSVLGLKYGGEITLFSLKQGTGLKVLEACSQPNP